MKPQDYSTRIRYRPPAAWYQRLNWLVWCSRPWDWHHGMR